MIHIKIVIKGKRIFSNGMRSTKEGYAMRRHRDFLETRKFSNVIGKMEEFIKIVTMLENFRYFLPNFNRIIKIIKNSQYCRYWNKSPSHGQFFWLFLIFLLVSMIFPVFRIFPFANRRHYKCIINNVHSSKYSKDNESSLE